MTYALAVEAVGGLNRTGLAASAHCVEGRTSAAENPHWYRLATFYPKVGRAMPSIKRHSPYVAAWIRKLEADDVGEDAELAARLAALPVPAWKRAMAAYRTHAQRMSAWYRELDRAHKPLTWTPTDYFTRHPDALSKWSEKRRQQVIQTAMIRGDIMPEAL